MQNRSTSSLPAVFADYEPMSCGSGRIKSEPSVLSIFEMTYLHFHRYIELGLCVSGSGICRVEGEEYHFSDGDTQVIFPFQKHLSVNEGVENGKWYWIYIDPVSILFNSGFADPVKIETWLRTEMALCGIIDKIKYPEIAAGIKTVINEVYNPSLTHIHPEESFAHCLYGLIIDMCDASAELKKLTLGETGQAINIAPALDRIKSGLDCGDIPDVSSLSALCNMSLSNFRHLFVKIIGVSPKEYIASCCIRRVQMLLITTDLKILDAAMAVGFSDISSFNRGFITKVGMTPSEFRRRYSHTE